MSLKSTTRATRRLIRFRAGVYHDPTTEEQLCRILRVRLSPGHSGIYKRRGLAPRVHQTVNNTKNDGDNCCQPAHLTHRYDGDEVAHVASEAAAGDAAAKHCAQFKARN